METLGGKVGFLFTGGSARTAFQVGVVEQLLALGVKPSMCLGVSSGGWNAAAVAVGNTARLRAYWRFFCRMPAIDIRNILREHNPFIWSRLHERGFSRYIGRDRLRAPETVPVFVSATRLRDRQQVIFDLKTADDPLKMLLATNYLPPFFTHAPVIDGERYGDGAMSNNLPYEELFERGCDKVVIMTAKGESEGGLFRNASDFNHEIPDRYRDRVIVIRPRHRIKLGFTERRWDRLTPIMNLGAARTREILLGEQGAHEEEPRGVAFTVHLLRWRERFRRVWR